MICYILVLKIRGGWKQVEETEIKYLYILVAERVNFQ